jgi:hypothetical protein
MQQPHADVYSLRTTQKEALELVHKTERKE